MSNTCPRCGASRSETSPAGLCPRCLLGNAMGSDVDLTYSFVPEEPGHVLEALTRSVGPMPRVLLPDTKGGSDEPPVVRPSSGEMPPKAERSLRVQLLGEIARGGMGAVLKGRDPDLGRDLAVKVLLEDHRGNPDLVRRFVEEAQIGGQLQHPGIVPVYELGTFGDSRPYFTMKLVKGRTLADLMAARTGPTDDRPRLIGIFEQIAQTVAYAHSRGVIHRDLKPSNVMVGSFGEVQVMDWGLAKVLLVGGASDDASAGKVDYHETIIATARSADDSDASKAGSVMGTPAYMAPEQARGEVARVDRRADVFSLGSILCEILTGRPAFLGRSVGEIQRNAALGDTADALKRLDGCGADVDLIALARASLAREPEDRLPDAGALSRAILAHQTQVQERLKAAELARVEATARADEEQKRRVIADRLAIQERARRRATIALAASLIAFLVVGGMGGAYVWNQRTLMATRIEKALAETTLLRDQARAHPEDPALWHRAQDAARRIADELETAPGTAARARYATLTSEIDEMVRESEKLATLRKRLVEIRAAAQGQYLLESSIAYDDAFSAVGVMVDLNANTVDSATGWFDRWPTHVVAELASFLDHWSASLADNGKNWDATLTVAQAVDHDEYRGKIRDLLIEGELNKKKERIEALLEDPQVENLSPATIVLLALIAKSFHGTESAVALLKKGVVKNPNDAWLNEALADRINELEKPDRLESIRYYTAARALNPVFGSKLAGALTLCGREDEALSIFRDLVIRQGDSLANWWEYTNLLSKKRLLEERERAYQRAEVIGRNLFRKYPSMKDNHMKLGILLFNQHKNQEAILEFREEIRLNPELPAPHYLLAVTLGSVLGEYQSAIPEIREYIRLDSDNDNGHVGLLGEYLLKSGQYQEAIASLEQAIEGKLAVDQYRRHLATAFGRVGRFDDAISMFQKSIQLNPNDAETHHDYAIFLCDIKNDPRAAVVEFQEAIRLSPIDDRIQTNLMIAYEKLGRFDESITILRELIHRNPNEASFHHFLGETLEKFTSDYESALKEYQEADRLVPNNSHMLIHLGDILRRLLRFDESVAAFQRGLSIPGLSSETTAVLTNRLEESSRVRALYARLPGVLNRNDGPKNKLEAMGFMQLCYDTQHYAASARIWTEAFAADPKIAEDRTTSQLYNAACSASLAAIGKGKDAPADELGRGKLRAQALDWLKLELALWSRVFEAEKADVARTLRHWRTDKDLVGIRDPDALAALPMGEAGALRDFWREVDATIERAEAKRP